MNPQALERLLTNVRAGSLSVEAAIQQLRTLPFEDLGFASVDHHRSLRQGFPEVIFCQGKTPVQVRAIAKALLKHHRPLLATRATRQVATIIKRLDRRAVYHDEARVVSIRDEAAQKDVALRAELTTPLVLELPPARYKVTLASGLGPETATLEVQVEKGRTASKSVTLVAPERAVQLLD